MPGYVWEEAGVQIQEQASLPSVCFITCLESSQCPMHNHAVEVSQLNYLYSLFVHDQLEEISTMQAHKQTLGEMSAKITPSHISLYQNKSKAK